MFKRNNFPYNVMPQRDCIISMSAVSINGMARVPRVKEQYENQTLIDINLETTMCGMFQSSDMYTAAQGRILI